MTGAEKARLAAIFAAFCGKLYRTGGIFISSLQ